ncbi:hypothetical protein HDU97_005021 [Phlyctochytrium planicorne]|nr:hypothetical protein HDU97_005021 [Phlyctochytrium planicorne]
MSRPNSMTIGSILPALALLAAYTASDAFAQSFTFVPLPTPFARCTDANNPYTCEANTTVTSLGSVGSPPPSPESVSGKEAGGLTGWKKTAAIAGGVVGGIVFLAVAAFVYNKISGKDKNMGGNLDQLASDKDNSGPAPLPPGHPKNRKDDDLYPNGKDSGAVSPSDTGSLTPSMSASQVVTEEQRGPDYSNAPPMPAHYGQLRQQTPYSNSQPYSAQQGPYTPANGLYTPQGGYPNQMPPQGGPYGQSNYNRYGPGQGQGMPPPPGSNVGAPGAPGYGGQYGPGSAAGYSQQGAGYPSQQGPGSAAGYGSQQGSTVGYGSQQGYGGQAAPGGVGGYGSLQGAGYPEGPGSVRSYGSQQGPSYGQQGYAPKQGSGNATGYNNQVVPPSGPGSATGYGGSSSVGGYGATPAGPRQPGSYSSQAPQAAYPHGGQQQQAYGRSTSPPSAPNKYYNNQPPSGSGQY